MILSFFLSFRVCLFRHPPLFYLFIPISLAFYSSVVCHQVAVVEPSKWRRGPKKFVCFDRYSIAWLGECVAQVKAPLLFHRLPSKVYILIRPGISSSIITLPTFTVSFSPSYLPTRTETFPHFILFVREKKYQKRKRCSTASKTKAFLPCYTGNCATKSRPMLSRQTKTIWKPSPQRRVALFQRSS